MLINYSFSTTRFGELIIGSFEHKICYIAFIDLQNASDENLSDELIQVLIQAKSNNGDSCLVKDTSNSNKIPEALKKDKLTKDVKKSAPRERLKRHTP